ncbi:MAG TPA: HlyD family efflux transporter periplasmic adaptor subunit [Polyangiaceae bacterium]|jgi:HlyD family type I secretion membrane fusion protein
MASAEVSRELLPCVDFDEARRAVRFAYGLSGLLVVAATVALFSIKTDVVVRGEAVVAPLGETARVQSVRGGMVEEILVHEGQEVTKGQPLIRLDRRRSKEKVGVLREESEAAATRASILEELLTSRPTTFTVAGKMRGVEGDAVAARLRAARAMTSARDREQRIRAIYEERARWLFEHKAQEEKLADNATVEADVAKAQAEAARAGESDLQTSLARLKLEREQIERESSVAQLTDGAALAAARSEVARLRGELADAELEDSELEIVTPRAGTVQSLAVFDKGDVLQPGALVAYVVPASEELVVRAELPSDGIAFVRDGQEVRVKLDAYPFQDFGVFYGSVTRVAADATRAGTDSKREATYGVEVRVANVPHRGGELLRLRPGMTGQAEFTVRRERIITSLLHPFRGTFDSVRN